MVTGDRRETAVAIAKDAGILDKNFKMQKNKNVVMDGEDFRKFVGDMVVDKDGTERVGDL